jgi:hypothetical protein
MATILTVSSDPSLLLAKNPSSLPINIQSTYDGRLLVSDVADTGNVNYSYTLTYNNAGVLSQEFRTFGGVTQIKTYTYDTNGNLSGESSWV